MLVFLVASCYSLLKSATSAIGTELLNIFFFIPIFLSIGIGIFFTTTTDIPSSIVYCLAALLLLVCLFIRYIAIKKQYLEPVYIIMTIVSSIAIGYSVSMLRSEIVRSPILLKETKDIILEGTISALDIRTESIRIYLTNLHSDQWNIMTYGPIPKMIRLNSYIGKYRPIPDIGDKIIVKSALLPPPIPVIPDGFDFSRYAYFKRIGAIGYIIDYPKIMSASDSVNRTFSLGEIFINKLRQLIAKKISLQMEKVPAAIAKGILIGDSSTISKADLDALRAAGTAHLIAVSGMHIAVVCAIVFFLTRFF